MKIIKKLNKTVLSLLVIMCISCSEDSPFFNPYQNIPQEPQNTGEPHTYNLTFSGGDVDGDIFSGSFTNNTVVAYRHQTPDGEGGEIDTITLSMAEEAQANNFNLGMLIRMDGGVPKPLNESDDENESHMVISYDDYVLNALSGSITMTNLGQITHAGVTYPYFKIVYSAEMNGGTSTNPNAFSTQVSGTIIVKQINFN